MKHIVLKSLAFMAVVLAIYAAFALLISTVAYIRLPKARSEALYYNADNHPEALQPTKAGDRVTLVEKRDDAWNARMVLLAGARTSLDIVYHSVHADDSGAAFWGEVVRAANRGVRVRVLLDGKVGASGKSTQTLRLLQGHPMIECRRFNPVDPLRPWRWHTLLHDKFIVADGEYLLLGGRNIGDRYYGPVGYTGELVEDRDMMVAGGGPNSVLHAAQDYMETLWTHPQSEAYETWPRENAQKLAALVDKADAYRAQNAAWYAKTMQDYADDMVETAGITLLTNPVITTQKEPVIGKALQELATQAEQTVLIQTPYATANEMFLDTISRANENAQVLMQTNSMAVSPNCLAFSNYYTNRERFLGTGAALYEYHGAGSIHGKSLVVDGRYSAVGSLNLDDRSMYIDTESVLLIDSEAFAQRLSGAVGELTAQSLRVSEDNTYRVDGSVAAMEVSRGKQVLMHVASWISRPFQFLI